MKIPAIKGPEIADMTVVNSLAEADQILKSPDFIQVRHQDRYSAPFLADTLLTLHGAAHFKRRRQEAVLFRRARLAFYQIDLIGPALARRLAEIRVRPAPGGVVRADLQPLLRSLLVSLAASVVGLDGLEDEAGVERLRLYVEQIAAGTSAEHATRDREKLVMIGLEGYEGFKRDFVDPSLARRRERPAAVEGQMDLLSLLVEQDDPWDDGLIVRECCLFLLASITTTTDAAPQALRHALDWVASHPEDELRLTDPEFLRRVANESLRVAPTVHVLLRRALRDGTLPSGRRFEEGQYIAIHTQPANHDATVFGADADAFNPHRPEGPRPFGLSFGGGAHTCMGRELTTGNPPEASLGRPLGVLVEILHQLFVAGVRLDPERAPTYVPDLSMQRRCISFPVTLRPI